MRSTTGSKRVWVMFGLRQSACPKRMQTRRAYRGPFRFPVASEVAEYSGVTPSCVVGGVMLSNAESRRAACTNFEEL